ncbi:hypothetical protein KXD40_000268 [Peronospora effusa]|nr:hypothetical protein KXD40_000268 [Peronospora effusa]
MAGIIVFVDAMDLHQLRYMLNTNEDWTKLKDKVTQFGPNFVVTVSEAKLFYQVLLKVTSVKREHSKKKSATAAATDMLNVGGKS